jgi:hypothetical protein
MTELQKTRSPAQLEILAMAREKAMAVRRENADLRRKEKEIAKAEKELEKIDRKKLVEDKLKKIQQPKPEVLEEETYVSESSDAEVEEIPVVRKKSRPKSKKKKKIVIVESESESEDEVVYMKSKAPKQALHRQQSHIPTSGGALPQRTNINEPQPTAHDIYYQKFFNH